MAQSKHPYNEAGRRLKAAMLSYQLGLKGVDRTLKEMPEYAGDGWAELAEKLLRGMAEQVGDAIFRPPSGGSGTVQ
jgi:hypothetical protein